MAILKTEQIFALRDETMAKIKAEFLSRYSEWLADYAELNEYDYGWKYGWCKSKKHPTMKDSITAVTFFQKYFYPVRDIEKMEKEIGIERQVIWLLVKEKWLSEVMGKHNKWEMCYFISQERAKEIWRESRK